MPQDSTHTLPVGAGGAGLTSLEAHAVGGYLGAFFRIAGPLQQRLTTMGESTSRETAASLFGPAASVHNKQWAECAVETHAEVLALRTSFSAAKRHTADLLAPRGNIIFSAGDPPSVVDDLPSTIEDEEIPELS